MVMEKYGPQFFVCKKTFYQRFVFPGSCNIVPSVGCSIGGNSVKLNQVHMMSHNICSGPELEGICFQIFR